MFDTTLFNVSIPNISANEGSALVLSGCRVNLSEDIPYSEFDELSYYSLNCNDFGCGGADIELSFDNNFKNPYFKFYIQCVAIRTDSGVLCKINRSSIHKDSALDNFSKITKDGKMALGLGYYFKTQKEYEMLTHCKSFCIEGFIAIKKKTNVYGFVCRLKKTDDGWQMIEGNTYRIYKRVNIRNLYH